ncbi:helix-turn-helix domain-containing protein [Breznakiellaceae bacterium SP9]
MARKEAAVIELNAFERKWLTELSKSRTAPHAIVQRARILLLAADKVANTHIVKQLGTGKKTVQRWRKRWLSEQAKLRALQASGKAEKDIILEIRTILQDAPRPGTPPTFTEAQIMQIQKLACEDPTKSGRELSQWSLTALADEAVKRGIVATISPASVQRFLKEANIQPHKSRYRLNSETKNKDPQGFKALIQEICNLYHLCVFLLTLRIHIVSVDEMTGIQALERIYADKPVLPGKSHMRAV